MFRKRKKKKGKKIEVNTDGDELPVDVVKGIQSVARKIGSAATEGAEETPEFLYAMRQALDNKGKPGPEDVLLLYIYGKGATSPEKAIAIPEGEENETFIFFLYADDFIGHAGDKVYISYRGIIRLQMLGALDEKGRILSPK